MSRVKGGSCLVSHSRFEDSPDGEKWKKKVRNKGKGGKDSQHQFRKVCSVINSATQPNQEVVSKAQQELRETVVTRKEVLYSGEREKEENRT